MSPPHLSPARAAHALRPREFQRRPHSALEPPPAPRPRQGLHPQLQAGIRQLGGGAFVYFFCCCFTLEEVGPCVCLRFCSCSTLGSLFFIICLKRISKSLGTVEILIVFLVVNNNGLSIYGYVDSAGGFCLLSVNCIYVNSIMFSCR